MKILSRYILKEHAVPFTLSALVITFILLIDRVIDLMNVIIEKKLDLSTIGELFALSLPYMLALSIPMAVLVATILAFGRMSVDRETIAMKASGINVYQMLKPLLVAALLLTGLMIYFNHWFLPDTNHKLKNLMNRIAYYKPMTIIKPNEYTQIKDYTVFCQGNNADELKDVLIYERSQTRLPKVVLARRGKVQQLDKGNTLRINLFDGEMHERSDLKQEEYTHTRFKTLTIFLRDLSTNQDYYEGSYRSDREMNYPQLIAAMQDKQKEIRDKAGEAQNLQSRLSKLSAQPQSFANSADVRRLSNMRQMAQDRQKELENGYRSLQVEYHKKFSLSFAVLIFVLIGIPLGMMTRSSGLGMAFSVSSVIFLIYYVALTGGEQLADKGLMSPFLSMWISNFVFLAAALVLIYLSLKEKQLLNLNLLTWRLSHRKTKKEATPDELIH